jgi:hypothetical protein
MKRMAPNKTNPLPPSPLSGEGKGEGPSGYKLGILVNFSKAKVEYQSVVTG